MCNRGRRGIIYRSWIDGRFVLLTCHLQLDELRLTLKKPKLAARIRPHRAGRHVNELKELAVSVDPLPHVKRSSDPMDDFLLAAAEAGSADYLVTGDKSGLLSLHRHKSTRIVPASEFAEKCLR